MTPSLRLRVRLTLYSSKILNIRGGASSRQCFIIPYIIHNPIFLSIMPGAYKSKNYIIPGTWTIVCHFSSNFGYLSWHINFHEPETQIRHRICWWCNFKIGSRIILFRDENDADKRDQVIIKILTKVLVMMQI